MAEGQEEIAEAVKEGDEDEGKGAGPYVSDLLKLGAAGQVLTAPAPAAPAPEDGK